MGAPCGTSELALSGCVLAGSVLAGAEAAVEAAAVLAGSGLLSAMDLRDLGIHLIGVEMRCGLLSPLMRGFELLKFFVESLRIGLRGFWRGRRRGRRRPPQRDEDKKHHHAQHKPAHDLVDLYQSIRLRCHGRILSSYGVRPLQT